MLTIKRIKVLLIAAISAMALGAVGVPTASASLLEAEFSSPWVKLTSTTGFTIKRNGGEAKSCNLASTIDLSAEGGAFLGSNQYGGAGVRFNCSGATTMLIAFNGEATYDTVTGRYYLNVADHTGEALQGPWGWYFQETGGSDNWPWVNGSGATSSTITLNEQWLGSMSGQKITISGTFTAKTASGGLITLSH